MERRHLRPLPVNLGWPVTECSDVTQYPFPAGASWGLAALIVTLLETS